MTMTEQEFRDVLKRQWKGKEERLLEQLLTCQSSVNIHQYKDVIKERLYHCIDEHRVKEYIQTNLNIYNIQGIDLRLEIDFDIYSSQLNPKHFDVFKLLSKNRTLTPYLVQKYIDQDFDWGNSGLSSNRYMNIEFIEGNLDKHWNWGKGGLSMNPNITPEFVEKHIDKDWYWGNGGLSSNPNITEEFIERHNEEDWSFKALSSHQNITPLFVEKYMSCGWDWGLLGLSKNPNLTSQFLRDHINKKWDWKYGLSSNLSITPDIVENFMEGNTSSIDNEIEKLENSFSLDKKYKQTRVSELKQLRKFRQWNWKQDGLSSNSSMTQEFIEKHMDKDWWWGQCGLSCNPIVSPDFVEKHMDKRWYWGRDGLSSNPTMTIEFIMKHKDKELDWGIGGLLTNLL